MDSSWKKGMGYILVILFTILLAVFVLAVVPSLIFNAPANESISANSFAVLNATALDSDNTTIFTFRLYGGNVSNLTNNRSLLYETNMTNGSNVTYNWTAPVLTNFTNQMVLLHFDNQSDFGENNGTVFDFSNTGNNGTCTGTTCPTWNRTGGKFAGAYQFDGSDDFWRIRNNAFVNAAGGTLEAWIKMPNTTQNGTIFAVKENEADARDYVVFWIGNGRLQALQKSGPNVKWQGSGSTDIANDTQYHVALTVNTSGNFFYVNGLKETTTYSTGTSSSTDFIDDLPPPPASAVQNNYIGKLVLSNADSQLFNGTIDEFAFSNVSVPDEELRDHARLRNNTYYWQIDAGNETDVNTSGVRNFIIGFDWNRTPETFGTVTINITLNTTLGNLTISHMGKRNVNLTINLSSDFNSTFFNETVPFNASQNSTFNLTVNTSRSISVNVTAPNASGSTTITLTMVAMELGTDTSAIPATFTTTATLVHVAADPFLDVNISQPAAGTVYPRGSANNVNITTSVINLGNGIATNVTLYMLLPDSGWVVTGGGNKTIGNLSPGSSDTTSMLVNITTSATTGTVSIIANASGNNLSGNALNATLINNAEVNVEVVATQEISDPGAGLGGGEQEGVSAVPTGGSSRGGGVAKVGRTETIQTTQSIQLLRGTGEQVPITVTNTYENAVMKDIQLEVQGFMSQYITINPVIDRTKTIFVDTTHVTIGRPDKEIPFTIPGIGAHSIAAKAVEKDRVEIFIRSEPVNMTLKAGEIRFADITGDNLSDIAVQLKNITTQGINLDVHKLGRPEPNQIFFGEARNYTLFIAAPPYMQEQNYNLTVKISAKIVPVNAALAGFVWRPLVEFRRLLFMVQEVSREEVAFSLEKAEADVKKMEGAKFPTRRVTKLLEEARAAVEKKQYGAAARHAEQIEKTSVQAFAADKLMRQLGERIHDARKRWLRVPESEQALALARASFEREDFANALQRGRDGQLVLILETKGRLNLVWFVLHYWWALLFGGLASVIVGIIAYKRLFNAIIAQRLKNMEKEALAIRELKEETQQKYVGEGKISAAQYNKTMAHYESRLNTIKQLMIRLRNKRVSILRTEQEIESVAKEEEELFGKMKEEQTDYFMKGTLTRRKFMNQYESDKERLAMLQEEKEVIQEKLEAEKISPQHPYLKKINDLLVIIETYVDNFTMRFRLGSSFFQERKASFLNKLREAHAQIEEGRRNEKNKNRQYEKQQHEKQNKQDAPTKKEEREQAPEPKRMSVAEIIKHYPNALTKEEQKQALEKEEQEKKKQEKGNENKGKKQPPAPQPVKKEQPPMPFLSQEPEVVEKRRKVYTMLKQRYNIDVSEDAS